MSRYIALCGAVHRAVAVLRARAAAAGHRGDGVCRILQPIWIAAADDAPNGARGLPLSLRGAGLERGTKQDID
jgi:hypothetical protein